MHFKDKRARWMGDVSCSHVGGLATGAEAASGTRLGGAGPIQCLNGLISVNMRIVKPPEAKLINTEDPLTKLWSI